MAKADDTVFSRSYRSRAGRFAVGSLYRGRLDSVEAIPAMMKSLRARWRDLIDRLHASGRWRKSEGKFGPKRIKFMRNCPWFGVVKPTDPEQQNVLRPCRSSTLCPFCYARDFAIKAYDNLAPLLPNLPGEKNTKTLFSFVTPEEFPPIDLYAEDGWYKATEAVKASILSQDRRADNDSLKNFGAVTFFRVRVHGHDPNEFTESEADGKVPDRLTLVRSTLMIASPRARVPMFAGTAQRFDDPTKHVLSRAVASAFRYPAEWYDFMSKVPVGLSVMLGKVRVFSSYGGCRKPRSQPSPKPEVTDEVAERVGDQEAEDGVAV